MNQLPGFDPRLNEPQGDAPGGSNGSHMTAVGSLWPVATVIPAPTSFTFGTGHAADSLGGAGAPLALAGTPSAAAIAPPLLTVQSPGGRGGYPPGALLSASGGGGGGGGETAGGVAVQARTKKWQPADDGILTIREGRCAGDAGRGKAGARARRSRAGRAAWPLRRARC